MNKKQHNKELQYINIPGGHEEVCNQWVEQRQLDKRIKIQLDNFKKLKKYMLNH